MSDSSFRPQKVGELRPSQILFTYGIGAIADLPNLAVMVMGLDSWDHHSTQVLDEERLLVAVHQILGHQVKTLRTLPMPPETDGPPDIQDPGQTIGIPVAPFPSWMVCPNCNLLASLQSGLFRLKPNPYRPNETRYVHTHCTRAGSKAPTVIPARFLVACERGHLDDFPWHYFVHRGPSDCKGTLRLKERGVTGAATDIMVTCDSCQVPPRRLSDAFGNSGKQTMPRCRGRHPHLNTFDDSCPEQMRGLLLGASNSWFGITLSALAIPLTSQKLTELVRQYWSNLSKATSLEMLNLVLDVLQNNGIAQDLAVYPREDIWRTIQDIQQAQPRPDPKDLKTPEWEVFSQAVTVTDTEDFKMSLADAPTGYEAYFRQGVLIERLREVRALIGFTRIQSPGDFEDIGQMPSDYRATLSQRPPTWVPGAEVRGEGLFLEFAEAPLSEWEKRPAVTKRGHDTRAAQIQWLRMRDLDPEDIPFPGMRYLLLHSFAHALMRQLALECGYNAASLRERIYARTPNSDSDPEQAPQAGVLIYTAAPDSEGTLGGLINLGRPNTLGYHITQALAGMAVCASDPLCASHTPQQGAASLHWAACHTCLFSPETSCERGNKYLDRSVLVPTLGQEELAFFPAP